MARKPVLEVANFVCKFGENDMHALLAEVVLPAFLTSRQRRTASGTYLLHEVELLALDNDNPGGFSVAGRLVKDMTLQREQVLTREGALVHDEKSMPSAPSSFFLLRLLGHRLCYVREMQFAPSVSEFESTMAFFLRHTYEQYVSQLHDLSVQKGERIPKTVIRESLGHFSLDVTHVASEQSISDFMAHFAKLKKLRFQLTATNAEADLNPFFRQWREISKEAGAKNAAMESRNPEGLNKAVALKQLRAAQEGHAVVSLLGVDANGKQLSGTNEDIKVRVPLPEVDLGVRPMAQTVSSVLDDLVKDRVVSSGPDDENARAKIASLRSKFKK